uniref:Lysophospholipid acyltransferase 5 n=1 Tax=Takifugu rubripes TaxID=31033 RepID=A0A674NSS9_TAKRU
HGDVRLQVTTWVAALSGKWFSCINKSASPAGYPFALVYRWFLFYQPATVLHLFHTLSGLALAVFNFGPQVYHSAVCVLVQFLMLRLMGRTVTTVLSSFVFQMVYLLAGYYYTATEEYDIKWTMPHCVLTLKLIGLSLDYYDGGKEAVSLSQQKSAALTSVPSLLEVFGFSYFYYGFLVGPQFTLQSYKKFLSFILLSFLSFSALPAMRRFALGFLFLVIYAMFSPYFPDKRPFWYRCVFMLLWAKFNLYKYVTCWLIAVRRRLYIIWTWLQWCSRGKHRWDACANMKVWLFETTPRFQGTIDSFNINTNEWAARSVPR